METCRKRKLLRCGFRERRPVGARLFEQAEGADDVGLDEIRRPVDRAIDVAFRREMHDGATGGASASRLATSARSPISPLTNTCRGSSFRLARFAGLPA